MTSAQAWSEVVAAHAIWGTLEQSTSHLESALAKAVEGDLAGLFIVQRSARVVSDFHRRLKASDPDLLAHTTLDETEALLAAVSGQLVAFMADGALTHLGPIPAHLDSLLRQGSRLLPALGVDDLESMGEAITSFRRSVAQHLRRVNEDFAPVEEKLAALSVAITNVDTAAGTQEARVDQLISVAQSNLGAVETQRVAAFQEFLTRSSDRFETAIGEMRTANAHHQGAQSERFEALRKDASTALDSAVASFESMGENRVVKSDELFAAWGAHATQQRDAFAAEFATIKDSSAAAQEEFDSRSNEMVGAIKLLQEEAQEIVGVIANTSMSGGYKVVADAERWSAMIWNSVAATSFAGFVGFAVYAALHFIARAPGESVDWGIYLGRTYASISFAVFGAFAARQAGKHHDGERGARRLQLAMASLDPYLRSLPEKMQSELKSSLAEKLLGQAEQPSPASSTGELSRKAFADFATELVKALPRK